MKLYQWALLLVPGATFAGSVTHIEAPGNLESRHDLGCISSSAIKNIHTPADLYPAVANCIDQGERRKAIDLYLVAGAYGYYDAHRVSDKTSRQAIQVLQIESLWALDEVKREAFQREFVGHMDSPAMQASCKMLRALGKPNYHPGYMIQHGIGAFVGNQGDGLLESYDADGLWSDALIDYVKCDNRGRR